MKTRILVLALVAAVVSSFGQGALTPSGAPAPTMRSLDQVYSKMDPRIAITNSGAVTIAQPGSYYLTTNITVSAGNGISITTSNVTLDLNGFTIASTAPSPSGMAISLAANGIGDITIFNGHIKSGVTNNGSGVYTGYGFQRGIDYGGSVPFSICVHHITVTGVSSTGIYLGKNNSTIAESCTVKIAGASGVTADSVVHCVALDCGASAIDAVTAADSRGECTGSASGVVAVTIQNCYGTSSSGNGIYGTELATGSFGMSTTGIGVNARNASSCVGYRVGGTAIQAFVATGCMAEVGTNNINNKYNTP